VGDDDSDTGTADHAAIAWAAHAREDAFRIESVQASRMLLEPMSTRSAIKTPAFGAKEAARLPRAKTTSPPMSERRRP